MSYQLYACARCQDWGTLVPGDDSHRRTVDPATVGKGIKYCDCPKGQALADAAEQQRDAGTAGQ